MPAPQVNWDVPSGLCVSLNPPKATHSNELSLWIAPCSYCTRKDWSRLCNCDCDCDTTGSK
jgi:hypothetical protein